MNIVRKGMELFPHHCAILKALGHDIKVIFSTFARGAAGYESR